MCELMPVPDECGRSMLIIVSRLIRFFTLPPAGVAFIDPGRGRGPADRLGLAAQLGTFPWLGFVRSG